MKRFNKYLAVVLLFVFGWVMIPVHTVHDLFADHEDTAENFCLVNHAHLGTHIEETHTHCDILDLNSPAYYVPDLVLVTQIIGVINSQLQTINQARENTFSVCNLPSRAPPCLS